MNRYHFSIPRNARFGSANALALPATDLRSPEHQHCRELLRAIATLESKKLDTPVKTEAVQVINGIISSLSGETPPQRTSVEENRVKFPKDETRGGLASFRKTSNPSQKREPQFQLHCQMPESGGNASRVLSVKGLSPAGLLPPFSFRRMISDLVGFTGFLVLLAALIAGVVATGMMVMGVGH